MATIKFSTTSSNLPHLSSYNFILGSGSKTRRDILSELGINPEIILPQIDEKLIGDRTIGSNPKELVSMIGIAKSDDILQRLKDRKGHYLITGDQVVVFNNKILEKPVNIDEARYFINNYRNSSCSTVGSIVLTNIDDGKRLTGIDTSTIYYSDIPKNVVESLLLNSEVLNCAGGLMVESPLLQPYIKEIVGTQDGLMGFSKTLFCKLMIEMLK
jgi:septum formation protein